MTAMDVAVSTQETVVIDPTECSQDAVPAGNAAELVSNAPPETVTIVDAPEIPSLSCASAQKPVPSSTPGTPGLFGEVEQRVIKSPSSRSRGAGAAIDGSPSQLSIPTEVTQTVAATPAPGLARAFAPTKRASTARGSQDGGDWSGRVAAEHIEGRLLDRLPLGEVQQRIASVGPQEDFVGLVAARRQMAVAVQALRNCEAQLRRASEGDQSLRKSAQAAAAEAAQSRAEADGLRRDIQRLKGVPRELAALTNDQLHVLQQDLSEAMRNVHAELENRSKCCICRFQERDVVLQPCMHLVLCRGCAKRVVLCPLCRREIESIASVKLA
eukprot:TRINITY_DN50212_c0_g1_i1.p1 TRINITY_DN50212_c0_g1~~TRINITY_DN50212_c0_g1_i1.p1  ORF type:complete len:327 (-),score=58.66 TRINITY_DN50212_c0_g1_i1:58-1038(-)